MALIVIREEKIESAHNGASEKPWGFGTDRSTVFITGGSKSAHILCFTIR